MKILILSSSAGNGHNSAAQRIKEKFLKEQPQSEIEIVDIYKAYASKLKAWIMEKGYFFACNHLMGIYNHYFKKSEHTNFNDRDKFKVHKQTYAMMHGVLNKIYDFKPDLIICTYIFAAVLITNIKRVYNIPAKVACMTLDYGISPYWECTNTALDYMFLTDDYMVKPFLDRGFIKEQLHVTGIPISHQFYEQKNKTEMREILNLDTNLFTIVIMKASFFPLSEKQIMQNLKKITKQIQVVVISGKNQKSIKKLDKLIKKYKLNHKIINLGFTKQIPEYFAACDLVIGKAGGLTTTETITSKLPSLIVNKLPMQEVYNKNFMVKNGCSIEVNGGWFYNQVNTLLQNPEMYNEMVENTINTRKMYAVENMYEVLKNIQTADYSDFKIIHTKKQLIKQVNFKRKNCLK